MNTELVNPIGKEEIEWVKAKHLGIQKTARRMLKDAIEIGQWFVEADERMGLKHRGGGGTWMLWIQATFPEMALRTVYNYMRLARGQELLEAESSGNDARTFGITEAINFLKAHDRKARPKPLELPPAEFDEPLLILRDELKDYVQMQFELEYRRAQIAFRIKNAKLTKRQVRQAVEAATVEHLEVREIVLRAFL